MKDVTVPVAIAYRFESDPRLTEEFMPAFEATETAKKKNMANEYIAEKEAEYRAKAANWPYVNRIVEVRAVTDFASREVLAFVADAKQTAAEKFSAWLKSFMAAKAPADCGPGVIDPVKAAFYGFGPRQLFKAAGLELARTGSANVLPPSLWLAAASCYYDIANLLIPEECRAALALPDVLRLWTPAGASSAADWNKRLDGWSPGVDLTNDLTFVCSVGIRMGILR